MPLRCACFAEALWNLLNQCGDARCSDGSCIEIPLCIVTANLTQEVGLFECLDAFSNNLHIKCLTQRNDSTHDGLIIAVAMRAADKAAVYLQTTKTEAPEIAQR